MDADYGYAGDTKCVDTKPLETIAALAEETERSAALIGAFIARFRHGNPPTVSGAGGQLKPVPSGHAGQIERLRDAVFEVDKLARELGSIG